MLEHLITILGTPAFIVLEIAILLHLFDKWRSVNSTVDQFIEDYYPMLVQGVNWAEKMIPDDTEQKHLKRADYALNTVRSYLDEHRDYRKITDKEILAAVSAVHNEIKS